MSLERVSSNVQPALNQPIAKVSKGTKRFGNKLESKITGMFTSSHKTASKVDHAKFTGNAAIAQDSPEVEALRRQLLSGQVKG